MDRLNELRIPAPIDSAGGPQRPEEATLLTRVAITTPISRIRLLPMAEPN